MWADPFDWPQSRQRLHSGLTCIINGVPHIKRSVTWIKATAGAHWNRLAVGGGRGEGAERLVV